MRLHCADEGGQVVEAVALVAGDGVAVAVVRPGSDKQHLPTGTGIEHFPARFPIRGKTVLEQLDKGETSSLNHVHDGPLALADAGRHEHGSTLGHHHEAGCRVFYLIGRHSSGAFHDDLIGAVEQETVAHDGDVVVTDDDVLLCFEKIWIVALGPQAARVVLQVLEHGIKLPASLQDAVVVTLFPEG